MLSINNDTPPGIDNLDGKLLRMVAYSMATPICHIFNQSLEGVAPLHHSGGSRMVQRSKALHLSARGITTDPGSIPGCFTTSRDQESHRAAHNWIVDYRKRRTEHAPILIDGAVVDQFLGVNITNKPTWSKHTETVVKRTRQNQETEKIWHGSSDHQKVLQLHH